MGRHALTPALHPVRRAGLPRSSPSLPWRCPPCWGSQGWEPEGAQGLKEQSLALWRPLVAMGNREQTPSIRSHTWSCPLADRGWACGASGPARPGVPQRGVGGKGYRMRSSRASAELMTGFPLCSVSSFWAAPPGWMMETMMMPTTTATKVVHR